MPANDKPVPGDDTARAASEFATTHWSTILTARGDSAAAAAALERLCRTYHYPLYVYARRKGLRHHDAQDLTQEFFSRLLQGNLIQKADPGMGRFRNYVLCAFERLRVSEWRASTREKRGGGSLPLSLDEPQYERRFQLVAGTVVDPDSEFDRHVAEETLAAVMAVLAQDRPLVFQKLKGFLISEGQAEQYAKIGAELGMSRQAVSMAVCRLRKRYRELFREAVAKTVSHPEEIDDEVRVMFEAVIALQGGSATRDNSTPP